MIGANVKGNVHAGVLQHEIDSVVSQLNALLSASISLFYSPCSKYPLRYHDNGSNVNAIQGSVVFHEDTLCSMEMLVKSTKTASAVKSTFRDDKQWKLQQIQDAINHLKLATSALNVFPKSSRNGQNQYSKGYIIDVLDKINRSINMCRMRLFSPCKLSLEALVSSGIVKMFTPPLPGDTIVNFFILEDSLVVTHYTVQQSHTTISKNSQHNNPASLFHPVGAILEHGGTLYEVATAHKADCPIPWLKKILVATDICLQLTNELREKLVHTK
uniref:protein rogdi homolog n=1 Tax=Styela clava TaxID=7725 RepID=UPI001939A43D|nr:protein rogdi homolog [Styela clava]